MSGLRQTWLVARRELRERIRSRAFRVSSAVMLLVVVGIIVLPALLDGDDARRDVGVAGTVSPGFAAAIAQQRSIGDLTVRVRRFDDVAGGEAAVRSGAVDVLVVDARRLEWKRRADDRLRAVVVGAIQATEIARRAAAAGITADVLRSVAAPVAIDDVELGSVAKRGPDDETAALIMTVMLFMAISTYGNLVLTGVVEEKASRVVEVLLTRIPARSLLAGKVAGIGLLGLAQFTGTAVTALIALTLTKRVDLPSVSATTVVWAVCWFVLGYCLYAGVYGAFGSLTSRVEDAQSAAGPVMVFLIAGYFASFAAVGRPDSGLAIVASFFPGTAPLAMPNRIAMGATGWWEPVIAALLTVAAIVWLVRLGGSIYQAAILRSGPAITLREAWRTTRPSRRS